MNWQGQHVVAVALLDLDRLVDSADGQDLGGQGVVYAADKPDHVSATRPECQLVPASCDLLHRYVSAMARKQQKRSDASADASIPHWLLALEFFSLLPYSAAMVSSAPRVTSLVVSAACSLHSSRAFENKDSSDETSLAISELLPHGRAGAAGPPGW
jgi:hypothetical protein